MSAQTQLRPRESRTTGLCWWHALNGGADRPSPSSICFGIVVACFLTLPEPGVGEGQEVVVPKWYRHHVIFLIDTTGSVYKNQGLPSLRRVLREELGPLLDDGERNGFGVQIYDPAQDLSTAMGFGLLRESPVFGPQYGDEGFLRVLWVQEPGRFGQDLADSLPTTSRWWTAFEAAFGSAVRRVAYELETRGVEQQAFERTFLVMVTDAISHATWGPIDEIVEIHAVAQRENPELRATLREDRKRTNTYFQLLSAYYSLTPSEDLDASNGIPVDERFKVLIRELIPHRRHGIDSLLADRPDQITELERRPGGLYRRSLRLVSNPFEKEADLGYQLLEAEFLAPATSDWKAVDWRSTVDGKIWIDLPEVVLPRNAVDGAEARFRLTFAQHDPAYGQSIQVFEDTIRFHREPTDVILGLIPVSDWRLGLTPGLSQKQVAAIDAWLGVFMLFSLVVFLLFFLLAPKPKANLEFLEDLGRQAPIPVDFNLASQDGLKHPTILRTLRFVNVARRLPGKLGRTLFRVERRFDVKVEILTDIHRSVVISGRHVGLSDHMEPVVMLHNLTHNAELVVRFNPGAIQDYAGDWTAPVSCRLRVRASQLQRPLWRAFACRQRQMESVQAAFALQFLPESPSVKARLVSGMASIVTGEPANLPSETKASSWLQALHMRHGAEDPEAAPSELILEVGTTAERVCSLPRTARLELLLYRTDHSEILRGAIDLDKRNLVNDKGVSIELVRSTSGVLFWKISGVTFNPSRDWPVQIPLRLDFDRIPLPPVAADDYIVEAQLFPIEGEDWPTVTTYHGLRVGPDPRNVELMPGPEAGKEALGHLAWRFFDAAGRQVGDGDDTSKLSVPEPVEICSERRPSRFDVRRLAAQLRPGLIGYFVHQGELPIDTEETLDTLRLQGKSIVPLSERLMSASLQDGTVPAVLHTVSQQGRGGDNLFRTRTALVDHRFFFGRSEILARIGSALGRGEQIILTGARKSGKTSFLNILRQNLEQPVAFIDLQRYDRMDPSWVGTLLHEIVAAYDRWGANRHEDWPAASADGSHPADALQFERMLDERRRWHSEREPLSRLVVMLDELERLLPQPRDATVVQSFIRAAGALRALSQGEDRFLSIIAADLRPTANRRNSLGDGTNPFFEFFQEIPLPLLDRDSVDEMVRTIGRMMGVFDVETPFLEELFDLSGGHPFVARTLAGAAYEWSKTSDELHLEDLRQGVAELEDDDVLGNFFAENFWSSLDEDEQHLLVAAAWGQPEEGRRDARASLIHQGLLLGGQIPIATFVDWIRRSQGAGEKRAVTA